MQWLPSKWIRISNTLPWHDRRLCRSLFSVFCRSIISPHLSFVVGHATLTDPQTTERLSAAYGNWKTSWIYTIDGLVQNYSNSSALAMELLQSWIKPSKHSNPIRIQYACHGLLCSILRHWICFKIHGNVLPLFIIYHQDRCWWPGNAEREIRQGRLVCTGIYFACVEKPSWNMSCAWVTEGSLLLLILLSMYGNENKIHNEALFFGSHAFKWSASVYVIIRERWEVMSAIVPAFNMSPFTWLMIAIGKINIKSLTTQMTKPLRLMKIRYQSNAKGSDWYLIKTNLRALAISGPSQYIKMSSYQYRDPHVKDKTVLWPFYL